MASVPTSSGPDHSGGTASLDSDLGFALGTVFRSYVTAAGEAISDLPGGPRGYQVLAAAVAGEANTQSALASRLGVDRTVMTYVIDDLERAKLVQRRPDPNDRRGRQIIATKQGERVWAQTQQRLRAIEDHVLGVLPDEDRLVFRHLLQRLATQANDLDPVDNPCALAELATDDVAPLRRARRS